MLSALARARQHLLAGDFGMAETLCREAMATPGAPARARKLLAECLYNQGVSLLLYGDMLDAAEKTFHTALEYDPKHASTLLNLGAINDRRGNIALAIDFYRRALKSDAHHLPSLQNLAIAYQQTDRVEEASSCLEQLARIDHANAGLYKLRNALLIKSIIFSTTYPDEVRCRMSTQLDACLASKLQGTVPERHVAPYFYLSYHGISNAILHKKISRSLLQICPSLEWTAPQIENRSIFVDARIRIGFISANLHDHSIGHTSRGLIEKLDRREFEVIVVRLGRSPQDDMAKTIDAAADAVVTVETPDLQAAREQIAALSLDILFYQDIGMEPFGYLLSFARLAPVQLTSFGHPDTTGVPAIDYFLSSDLYEVDGAEKHYTERLVQLPNAGTLSYYYRPDRPADKVSRAEFGLTDDTHLYFCPQTLFKMHPDMDEIFHGILCRDALARIVLIEPAQAHMRTALEKRWKNLNDFDVDRMLFIKRMPHTQYLRLMSCADVMLDTVHFNGQNTNLEAFALGIPVVTLPGEMQRERHTIGMYRAMGETSFSELIAKNKNDYADKAVRVAIDKQLRAALQDRIAQRSCVLYEDIGFVRSCENALRNMLVESRSRYSTSQLPADKSPGIAALAK